jgi:hypothetical protein
MTADLTAQARTALAEIICEAAPLIASGLTSCMSPNRLRFRYSTHGVTVTGDTILTDSRIEPLTTAFTAAGWGFSSELDDRYDRVAVTFQPPHMLTQTGAPIAPFPPR